MVNVGFHSVWGFCFVFLLLVDFDICHVTSARKETKYATFDSSRILIGINVLSWC